MLCSCYSFWRRSIATKTRYRKDTKKSFRRIHFAKMLLGGSTHVNQTTFEITFDNPLRQYYPGEKISGHIRLTLHKEFTLRGRAFCRWTEGNGSSSRTYTGEEVYIRDKNYVAGSSKGPHSAYAAAEYTYPFDWTLPTDLLPISFEGHHGHVRYQIVAGLDRPFRPDKCYTEAFSVLKRVDLNDMPDLNYAVEMVKNARFARCCVFCCFCCRSSPLIMTGRLVVGGFVPGDIVGVQLGVVNRSSVTIKKIKCKFVQTITYTPYKSNSHKKIETITLAEQEVHGCAAKSSEDQRIDMFIPDPLLPSEASSNVCKLQYDLVITGTTSGCHMNPVLTIPIVIGTHRLNQQSTEHLEAFPSLLTATTFDGGNLSNDYATTYGFSPPPRY